MLTSILCSWKAEEWESVEEDGYKRWVVRSHEERTNRSGRPGNLIVSPIFSRAKLGILPHGTEWKVPQKFDATWRIHQWSFSLVPNPEIWSPTDQSYPVCLADSFRLVIEIGRKKLMLPPVHPQSHLDHLVLHRSLQLPDLWHIATVSITIPVLRFSICWGNLSIGVYMDLTTAFIGVAKL